MGKQRQSQRPSGYWRDWSNVERELRELIEKLGHFPTQKEMEKHGKGILVRSIYEYHGDLTVVRERMGYQLLKRPRGYWHKWENVERELRGLIARLGHFPSATELKRLGKSSLLGSFDQFGGTAEVQERLGFTASRRPPGYWQQWENVARELQELADTLGHFPTLADLEKHKPSLRYAIVQDHRGYTVVRTRFGVASRLRDNNYWRDWSNVERELRELIEKLGRFPTQNEIAWAGKNSLVNAMTKYYGGLAAVRARMGYTAPSRLYNRPGQLRLSYWRDWSNVERELCELARELGHFPSAVEVRKAGKHSLASAIQDYHGGFSAVRKRMGVELSTRPSGYWRDWSNVERELRELIEKLGRFPSARELKRLEKGSLASAITKYHGGYRRVQEKLGFRSHTRPAGYWAEWSNIERELGALAESLGHFPTSSKLQKQKRASLLGAIEKYHGGYRAVRTRFGVEMTSVPPNYWRDWANVERELRELIEKFGHFPSQKEIAQAGKCSLTRALSAYHGGLQAACERLGYAHTQRPKGYWANWPNVERDLKAVVSELGRVPNREELAARGLGSLIPAIEQYHGGMRAVRDRLGYGQAQVPPNYWRDWANVERILREFVAQHGHFPSLSELQRTPGYKSLPTAIAHHHGGFRAVMKRIGSPVESTPPNYWRDWANVERELRKVAQTISHFPTGKELRQCGLSGLAVVIPKYHGGFPAVRKRMGFTPLKRRPQRYWKEWANVECELRKLIETLGHFPTQRDMTKLGKASLVVAIGKFGGFAAVAARLGYAPRKRPPRYYHDFANVARELCELAEELEHFPTVTELWTRKYSSLVNAITGRYGGFAAVRARMGYGPVTDEILKVHAESLVRVLLTLQKERQELSSDQFWGAIKGKWTEAQFKAALQAFDERQDLSIFRTLIQGG